MYNYEEILKEDILNYLKDNYTEDEMREHLESFSSRQQWEEDLHDALWVEDSVTGNASGSYTFSTYQAEENLAHNWDLMQEVADEFGVEPVISGSYEHGPEWWDVSIRCYLLSGCLSGVLDDLEDELGV